MSTTVTYKGNTLTTVSNETKKLNTAGTWLEGDITITDSSSGSAAIITDTTDTAGGTIRTITTTNEVHLQANKNVTPTSSVQVVLPDTGYDGLAQVTVGAGGSTPSATAHTIYFEFSDSTDATINAWYDSSFISDAITATTPTTYGQKTVDSASLDGVVWYTRPTETWETVYNVSGKAPNQDTPYNYFWLSENDLGNVYPTANSVWRITIDNTEYRCTAIYDNAVGQICVGNPKYSGGTDDGSDAPFDFYNGGWGSWVGDTELVPIGYSIKIERLVTS